MSDDDNEEAWGNLDEKQDANVGPSKSLLRKARALNPQLAAQGSTTELFTKMKGVSGNSAAANPGESAPANRPGGVDLVSSFFQMQQKYKDDKRKLQDDINKLQKQLHELAPKALEKFVDIVLQADPNMVSIQTQEILKTETQFLNEIGFTVRKVIERKVKKK